MTISFWGSSFEIIHILEGDTKIVQSIASLYTQTRMVKERVTTWSPKTKSNQIRSNQVMLKKENKKRQKDAQFYIVLATKVGHWYACTHLHQ